MTITVYTDGACKPNPGKGGWAAILIYDGKVKEISGSSEQSTNNTMELQAVYEAIKAIKVPGCQLDIHTDSQLVIGWMTEGWARRESHIDKLCRDIDLLAISREFGLIFNKVKAHSGNKYNERANFLAELRAENQDGRFSSYQRLVLA